MAEDEVAAHGANASLEQIARVAGVGSATVRRHFPTRQALLEAVSHQRIEALCDRAAALAAEAAMPGDSGDRATAALLAWLDDVLTYSVAARGLAAALTYDGPVRENSCSAALEAAGEPLLRAAAHAIPQGATVEDFITLIVGIVLATEQHPDPLARARRLFGLAVAGLRPPPG